MIEGFGASSPRMDRRKFLRLGGAGLAGAALLGTAGGRVLAQAGSSLSDQVGAASAGYNVPEDLLLAMGYVNTLWEMPPPTVTPYQRGDLHGRGAYGIMQLEQTPSRDTLGRAAELTGLTEARIKRERASSLLGGAAVLASLAGATKPDGVNGWQEAVAEYGGSDLYAREVYTALEEGASLEISTGERVRLAARDVDVPPAPESRLGAADYPPAAWRPAHRGNYSPEYNRERDVNIDKIIIHVAQGSYAGTLNWFQDSRAGSSAHYTVGRSGRVGQSVHNADVAWHAGWWAYNKRSIGIEHAGYVSNPNSFSIAMYNASARLTAWLCRRHRIPITRANIIGHNQVPGCSGAGGGVSCHTDPGRHWNWIRYINRVRFYRQRL